mmetsp:Transcript_52231/g.144615  ORF Transcript_52231/g.144615 Transcript_52231/m.144615 type:complete len:84 (+) Transcript_52231:1972-2223(+)
MARALLWKMFSGCVVFDLVIGRPFAPLRRDSGELEKLEFRRSDVVVLFTAGDSAMDGGRGGCLLFSGATEVALAEYIACLSSV